MIPRAEMPPFDLSPSAADPAAKRPLWRHPAFAAAALFLVVLLLYWPSYHAGFIWDDDMMTDNPLVKGGWKGLWDIWFSTKFIDYVPLTSTSFWLEHHLWGMGKSGYHATNVLLHALNVALLWRVLRALKLPGAWVAALLFGMHPVCVASVTWVAERKNTLSMLFYLLSLLFYLRSDQKREAGNQKPDATDTSLLSSNSYLLASFFYPLSFLSFLLGLCAKTSIVILPIALLLCVWWLQGQVSRRDMLRTIPFFAAALVFGLITIFIHHYHGPDRIVELSKDNVLIRSLGGGWAVWFYLGKDLLPLNLTMHYPRWEIDPASFLSYLPAVLIPVVLILFWRFRRSWGRACLFGSAYFIVALLPTLGLLNMAYLTLSQVADHFQYLALPGLIAWVVATLWTKFHKAFKCWSSAFSLQPLAFSLLALPLAVLCWQHQKIIGNPEAMWRDNIAKNPASWPARNNLGRILAEQGRYKEAEQQCRAAIASAPDSSETRYNLGIALFYQNKLDDAAREFSEAVRLAPADSKCHNNLAGALLQKGATNEACLHYREAIRLDPANFQALFNLGNILSDQGHKSEAVEYYSAALRLEPNDAAVHNNFGQTLASLGRLDEAIVHFSHALRLNPASPEAHSNLGNALALKGELDQAALHYSEAVQLFPDNAFFRMGLAGVLARQGKQKEAPEHDAQAYSCLAVDSSKKGNAAQAIAHWREALKFKPESKEILNNLAWILSTDPDPQYRNGLEAVQLSERAGALSRSESNAFLDTLAAAYAEAGRFDDAVGTSQRAVNIAEQAGQKERAAKLRQRLQLYLSRQPYHEPK